MGHDTILGSLWLDTKAEEKCCFAVKTCKLPNVLLSYKKVLLHSTSHKDLIEIRVLQTPYKYDLKFIAWFFSKGSKMLLASLMISMYVYVVQAERETLMHWVNIIFFRCSPFNGNICCKLNISDSSNFSSWGLWQHKRCQMLNIFLLDLCPGSSSTTMAWLWTTTHTSHLPSDDIQILS